MAARVVLSTTGERVAQLVMTNLHRATATWEPVPTVAQEGVRTEESLLGMTVKDLNAICVAENIRKGEFDFWSHPCDVEAKLIQPR